MPPADDQLLAVGRPIAKAQQFDGEFAFTGVEVEHPNGPTAVVLHAGLRIDDLPPVRGDPSPRRIEEKLPGIVLGIDREDALRSNLTDSRIYLPTSRVKENQFRPLVAFGASTDFGRRLDKTPATPRLKSSRRERTVRAEDSAH